MRSWTLRQPSPQIKKHLFGIADAAVKREETRSTITLPWYQTFGASVAVCALVLLTVLNFTHLRAIQNFSTPFGPLSNHLSSLAMVSAPNNTWTAPILGWTNDSTVGSPIRPFDLLNTNRILR